jgi:hypothetical protein
VPQTRSTTCKVFYDFIAQRNPEAAANVIRRTQLVLPLPACGERQAQRAISKNALVFAGEAAPGPVFLSRRHSVGLRHRLGGGQADLTDECAHGLARNACVPIHLCLARTMLVRLCVVRMVVRTMISMIMCPRGSRSSGVCPVQHSACNQRGRDNNLCGEFFHHFSGVSGPRFSASR